MKILSVSDVETPFIYSPTIKKKFADIDWIIGCGDLRYSYLEYMMSMLNKPLYFVRGNHCCDEFSCGECRKMPWGAEDLHKKVIYNPQYNLIMAGIEGSIRYSGKSYQYTQGEMWEFVWRLVPELLLNKWRYGRYLDLFITHAPPWGIHDKEDLPHQGIKAFRWLIERFQPRYHIHGHIHIYSPNTVRETQFNGTRVINTFGYYELKL